MKKIVLPVAFAATMSLAACGGSGSKTAQTMVSVSQTSVASSSISSSSSSTPPSKTSTAPSSVSSSPATSSTHSAPATPLQSTSPATQGTSNSSAASAKTPVATHSQKTSAKVVPAPPVTKPTKSTSATPATKVSKVWPDSSWKIETADTDLCGMMGESTAYPSGFSASTWTCGALAENLLACKKDASGNALCIRSYEGRSAVRFKTTAVVSGKTSGKAIPLAVKLSDGTMCGFAMHDQAQHYQGRHGWLYCDNEGTLLLPSGNDGGSPDYFDKSGSTWTAQLGMGTNAPTTVKVAQIYYAQ